MYHKPEIQDNSVLPLIVHEPNMEFNQWVYERVQPYLTGRILEIDSNEGYISPVARKNGTSVEVSTHEVLLRQDQAHNKEVCKTYDTIIDLNALQNPYLQTQFLRPYTNFLNRGSYFITSIPAKTALYKGLDVGFRAWKRKNKKFATAIMNNQFELVKIRFYQACLDYNQELNTSNHYNERVKKFVDLIDSIKPQGLSMLVIAIKV